MRTGKDSTIRAPRASGLAGERSAASFTRAKGRLCSNSQRSFQSFSDMSQRCIFSEATGVLASPARAPRVDRAARNADAPSHRIRLPRIPSDRGYQARIWAVNVSAGRDKVRGQGATGGVPWFAGAYPKRGEREI